MGVFNRNRLAAELVLFCFFFILPDFGRFPLEAHAGPTIHEILPIGETTSTKAYGINDAGVVCGKSYTTDDDDIALLWDQSGGSTALVPLVQSAESVAWDVNDSGQASGVSRTAEGSRRAVRWNDPSTIVDIGTLPNPVTGVYGNESDGYGINSGGTVVGWADIPNEAGDFTAFHAFLFNGATTQDLGTLNTTGSDYQYGYSIAYNSNDLGETVGLAHDDSWDYKPFIYDSTNGMQALPVDPTYADGEWYAAVINDNGWIGGSVIASSTETFPYYWPNRNSLPVKIAMPADFPNGEIYGINNDGQMVGIMWNNEQPAVEHGFIFDPVFGVRDLNDLVEPASGWQIAFAREINNSGQIARTGTLGGNTRGFMLDNLALNTPGDVNNDGSVDLRDTIIALQVVAGSVSIPVNQRSDVNGDAVIGLAEAVFTLDAVGQIAP